MTKDEELEQLPAENRALREALQQKDTELEQSQQGRQDLREGLKQALIAIGSQQERLQALEEVIAAQQERVTTQERQQDKDSHNSSLPPVLATGAVCSQSCHLEAMGGTNKTPYGFA